MIFHYVDASAWVKRYYREIGTTWVQSLFARGSTVACSSLGLVEVLATLARKAKAREIGQKALAGKLRELDEDWGRFIQIHLTVEAVTRAKNVAREQALRGADAVHLASALMLQSRFVDRDDRLVFVASDRELRDAARISGLDTVDPEEEEKTKTRKE